jgi:Rieske Fe-S protein
MSDISRRNFLKLLQRGFTFTGLAALAAPIVTYFFPSELEEMPSEPVLVSPQEDLPLLSSKTIQFGRYPALVIHTEIGLKAYSAVCTHFACIVKWDSELGQIVCPCHEGYFDPMDGHVLSGPPPTPLESLPVSITDGKIFIGGQS